MAKRWRPPFDFRRYCGASATGKIHDLVCEKLECDVGSVEDENITMWDTAEEVQDVVASGTWQRCELCTDTPLYFTPREDLRAVSGQQQ